MLIGLPREIKSDEYRVAMLPSGVEELTRAGHRVLVERGAGAGSGIADDDYAACGAEIVQSHADVFAADVVIKVKEPLAAEWPLLRRGQVLFTYFHFAADEELTRNVLESGVTAVAYETLKGRNGDLPLLTPMSEVAGRMSIQQGAKFLERPQEGRGILLGGVFPELNPHTLPSLVAELWERMQPALPPDFRPMLFCWTSTSNDSATSTTSCRQTSIPCSAIAITFASSCGRQT
jgi:alanine dehydrogenase